MNKRFFSEFLALLSIKVNPDPYLRADPEIDVMKTEDDGLANGQAFYDEEELGINIKCLSVNFFLCLISNFSKERSSVEEKDCLEKAC